MRRALISLFAFAVAASTLVLAGPATAGAALIDGRIAYVSGEEGLFEIYSARPDGTGIDNLTEAPDAVDVDPAWRPVAYDEIAFARQGKNAETFRLWTMDADGANREELDLAAKGGSSDRQPTWSTSGTQIAFTRQSRGNDTSHIYVTSSSGGGPATQLTSTPAPGYDASPAWEPSGSRIAFVSDRNGGIPQIFTMDASGANQTQVTTEACFAASPSWHPVDDRIVYERLCPGSPTGWDIVTIDLANLAAAPLEITSSVDDDHQPSWGPTGNDIVFTRHAADGDKNLYTVNGTVSPVPLVDESDVEIAPDWGGNVTARSIDTGVPRIGTESRETAAPAGGGGKGKKGKGNKRRFRVSPGVKYRRFRKGRSDAYLLTVNPDRQATIDVALSNDRLPGHEKTKKMAKRHGAVAAINGDFGTPSGRPSHTFAEDGLLHQLSFAAAWNFAISRNEQQTFVDRPFETVTADEISSDRWRIDRWNFGEPAYNDISAFTAAGGTLETPPANACAARLTPATGPRWAPGMQGVETPYTVAATACSTAPMSLDGGVVLAAQPGSDGAILLDSLVVGETIDITWSLGWEGVADTVGGTPLLVEGGNNAVKNCKGSICGRNPRTAIGVTAAGKVLMLVIDGRSDRSKGVTMTKLAKIMIGLRAVFALNLDGGGSSTMVVRGKVMNRPSDGKQRKVSSAVLVLNGPDAEESIGDPVPREIGPPIGGGLSPEHAEAALMDPASTGGLLEALAEGTFGPKVDLPPELERALRRFQRGT